MRQEIYSILIVDNLAIERERIKTLLAQSKLCHYLFFEADSVENGLEIFFTEKIDCILTDYVFSGRDALYMIKRLTNKLTGNLPPIIIVTAKGNEEIAVTFLKEGATDYLRKDNLTLPLIEQAIQESLKQKKLSLKVKEEEFENKYQALHDDLTDLFNRRALFQGIRRAIEYVKRYDRLAALLFCDLNQFKKVNDTFGHEIGDLLLQAVANRLKKMVRISDMVVRIGGDEFIILIEDLKNPSNAEKVAQTIGKAIHKPFLMNTHQVEISMSIGIAYVTSSFLVQSPSELVKQADMAMYHAKRTYPEGGYHIYKV